ncbi:hypothetical protein [Pseudomonas frederiksbergensis]|uniref:hypothetical protein n=1 Tax=Pseudomonas frederiksbergensis TaxID=104087 RepID=UPI003D2092AA
MDAPITGLIRKGDGFISESGGQKINLSPFLLENGQPINPATGGTVTRGAKRSLEDGKVLVLKFEGLKLLKIVPERNGLESYVVATRFGICPVGIV